MILWDYANIVFYHSSFSINNSCLLCLFIWFLSDDSYFCSIFLFVFFFLDKFHYVVQAALVLMILLPLSLECWDCSWELPAHFFLYLSFVVNCDHWEILLAIFCFLLTCPPIPFWLFLFDITRHFRLYFIFIFPEL